MKFSTRFLRPFLLMALTALAACRTAPALPTLVPTVAPRPASPTAVDISATPAAAPAPSTTPYAPRPTATPYLTPTTEPGVYANNDYGVRIRYPKDWRLDPGEDASTLTWMTAPDDRLVAAVFTAEVEPNQTLQQVAAEIRDASFEGLSDLKTLRDEPLVLQDGRLALSTLVVGSRDDGLRLKLGLTTTLSGRRAFSVFSFGVPEDYDALAAEVSGLVGSLHVEAKSLYGLPRSQTLVLASGESTNPRDYDPATAQTSGDRLAFSGLVAFDAQLKVVPDLAATWEVAEGGTRYIFHLRPQARFHNGRPVTASDVVYSWDRAAAPETGSDTVLTYLSDIVGVKERHAGQAEQIAGLRAVDEHTLEVTIDAPKPYFLLKLTATVALVVDRENVESGPEWYRAPNGTGPYRLARWERFQSILYERNDDYYGTKPAIPYVVMQLYAGVGTRLYETGEIDITGVGSYDLPRVMDPAEPMHADLRQGVNLCTGYVVFDVRQPPFDDPKVRQAFSMAFDRQKYIDVVLRGVGLPARGLFPPGLPGYNADRPSLSYDPERARQLLAESRYGGSQGLPPIVYTSGGTGSDVGGQVAALVQMWQQTLGVAITVENIEPDRYYDELHAGRHGQIFNGGWCADYPDPENFADVLLHSGAPQNLGGYSNPAMDALLEQARTEPDVAKRIQLYQQTEQIIVDDAPLLFTTHSQTFLLVKPYIQGFVLTPIGGPVFQNLSIDVTKLTGP